MVKYNYNIELKELLYYVKKKVLNMLDLLLIGCLMLFIYLFCVNLTGVYNSKDIEQILENNTIYLNKN